MRSLLVLLYVLAIQYNRWLANLANDKAVRGIVNMPASFRFRTVWSMKLQAYIAPVLVLSVVYFYDYELALALLIAYPAFRFALFYLGVITQMVKAVLRRR